MGDWQILGKNLDGGVKVVSPGYNSKYCLDVYAHGHYGSGQVYCKYGNVAYTSDAIMVVFWGKFDKAGTYHFGKFYVGHTGYGELPIMTVVDLTWRKYRVVFYYNDNLGYAVCVVERFDESTGEWKAFKTKTFTNITEPKAGNFYFKSWAEYGTYSWTGVNAYIDNIELYTSKSLYVTKIVSEAVENVISKQ